MLRKIPNEVVTHLVGFIKTEDALSINTACEGSSLKPAIEGGLFYIEIFCEERGCWTIGPFTATSADCCYKNNVQDTRKYCNGETDEITLYTQIGQQRIVRSRWKRWRQTVLEEYNFVKK